jgi:hypothetical protein
VLLDVNDFGGGQPGPFCPSCKRPLADERTMHIVFETDPHGFKGLSGHYHAACGRPFASMANALNQLSRPRR